MPERSWVFNLSLENRDKEGTPDVTPEDQPEELVKAEKVLEESSPLLTEEDRDIQRKLRYIEITQT